MTSDESDADRLPARTKPSAPKQFTIDLAGDRRDAENIIVEVYAIARRLGVEISDVQVKRKPSARPKSAISRRKSYSSI
jgi:hypothetical protein